VASERAAAERASKADLQRRHPQALDLGDVAAINIGFASKKAAAGAIGSLFGAAWHLSHVELRHLNTGKTFLFYHNDWIRGKTQGGRVDIPAGGADGANVYVVSVHTSDLRGAGTDACVRLTLFGRAEDGVERQFPPAGERGAVQLASRADISHAPSHVPSLRPHPTQARCWTRVRTTLSAAWWTSSR